MDDVLHGESHAEFSAADDALASATAETSRQDLASDLAFDPATGRARAIPQRRHNLKLVRPAPAAAGWRQDAGHTIANQVGADGLMREFTVTMMNQLRFSTCEAPWQPITRVRKELLSVAYRDDYLTLTELKSDGSFGSRIYAQRSVELPGLMTFLILRQLPSGTRDGAFFPASGTAVVFAPADGSPRRLNVVGTDVNSGRCHGWLFDAVEI